MKKPKKFLMFWGAAFVLGVLDVGVVPAADDLGDLNGAALQVLLGASFAQDVTFENKGTTDPSVNAEVDFSTLPHIGIVGQMPFAGDEALSTGIESGLTFNYWLDDATSTNAAGNDTVFIDASLFLTDFFAGTYINSSLGKVGRVYLGLGPLLMFGYAEESTEERDQNGAIINSRDEKKSAFGVGGYVRTGIEFKLPDNSLLGVGVRGYVTQLDFEDPIGKVDAKAIELDLTYTMGF